MAIKPVSISDKEARKQYSRIRGIVVKRLQRLSAAGLWDDSTVTRYKGFLLPLSEVKTDRQLSVLLYQVQELYNSPYASVKGQRAMQEKAIDTFHQHGYTFINKYNIREFGLFMQTMKNAKYDHVVGSDVIASAYEIEERADLTPEQMRDALSKYLQLMEDSEIRNNLMEMTADELRRIFVDNAERVSVQRVKNRPGGKKSRRK